MVVAVTYEKENGQVFQHFGHSEYFKIYEIEDGKIQKAEVYDTNGQGHGALADFLHGYAGDADEAVAALAAGKLSYDPDTTCSHHEGEHNCGEHDHGCGGHSCGNH